MCIIIFIKMTNTRLHEGCATYSFLYCYFSPNYVFLNNMYLIVVGIQWKYTRPWFLIGYFLSTVYTSTFGYSYLCIEISH